MMDGNTTTLTAEQATQQLDVLRADRIAGRVTEKEFFARMDQLGPVASGSPAPGATSAPAGQSSISPAEYRIDYQGRELAGDDLAIDTEIRAGMAAMNVPPDLGSVLYENIERLSQRFANASAADIGVHVQSSKVQLRQRWGSDFDSKIAAIDQFIEQAAVKSPFIDDLLASAPWVFADPAIAQWLDAVIERRKLRA